MRIAPTANAAAATTVVVIIITVAAKGRDGRWYRGMVGSLSGRRRRRVGDKTESRCILRAGIQVALPFLLELRNIDGVNVASNGFHELRLFDRGIFV